MTDLAQRAQRILESLACDRCPACDNKYGTTPDQQWYCEGCGERWETSNEAADLIRELLAENEILAARVLELECGKERARKLREAGFVPRPSIPSDADEFAAVDAGPTPLRGRVTRRDE